MDFAITMRDLDVQCGPNCFHMLVANTKHGEHQAGLRDRYCCVVHEENGGTFRVVHKTARGGELIKTIDSGLLFRLYKEYRLPNLTDPQDAFEGFENKPWGDQRRL